MRAAEWFETAKAKAQAGDRDGAAEALRQAAASSDLAEEMCWSVVRFHLELGQVPDADRAAVLATVRFAESIQTWNQYGDYLVSASRHDEALGVCDRLIALVPQSATPWINKAVLFNNLGRYDEALQTSDRAIAMDPHDEGAWYNRGITLDGLGRFDKALEAYNRTVELNPQHARAWTNKGSLHYLLGHHDNALAANDRALAADPQLVEALVNRGNVFLALGRYDEALDACNRAISVRPGFEEAWANKGIILLNHPRLVEADSPVSGERCLHRAALLMSSISPRNVHVVVGAVHRLLHAPLLLRGLIERWRVESIYFGDAARLAYIERETRLPVTVVQWLQSDDCPLPKSAQLRLVGQTYLTFGDPVCALDPLDELNSLDGGNLAGQLHLAWAMMECLEDTEAQIASAVAAAGDVIANNESQGIDCYYAGHIYFLAGDLASAQIAFARAGNGAPALIMQWLCATRREETGAAMSLIEQVLETECAWIRGGVPRSLLFSVEPPPIDPRSPEGLDELRWMVHTFEVQEAVTELLLQLEVIENSGSPRARARLKEIEGQRQPVHEAFEEHRQVWRAFEGFANDIKEYRRKVDEQRLFEWRDDLRDDLETLGIDLNGDLRIDPLVSALARRIQQIDLGRSRVRVEECIALLLCERRLALHPATLLIVYAAAKKHHDVGMWGPHRHLVAKAALSTLIAAPLKQLGLDFVSAVFVSYVGMDLAGWLADHAQVAIGNSADGQFPSFGQFVRELHKRWYERGGPESLQRLFEQ